MNNLAHHQHPRRCDYVGDSDQDVRAFISNLAHQLQSNPGGPEAFGLTADDLATIIAARDAYEPLYLACAKNHRTTAGVVDKNTARDEADRISRMYAQIIKCQPNVSNALKSIVHVTIEKPHRRMSTGRPRTFPHLFIDQRVTPGLFYAVKARFQDSALGTGRMPREDGVTHMILHAEIAANGKLTMKASSLRVVAHVTRNPHTVKFDRALFERFGLLEPEADVRNLGVMLCGQWLNAKGEVGPLGPAVLVNVPVRHSSAQAKAEPEAEAHHQQSVKQAA